MATNTSMIGASTPTRHSIYRPVVQSSHLFLANEWMVSKFNRFIWIEPVPLLSKTLAISNTKYLVFQIMSHTLQNTVTSFNRCDQTQKSTIQLNTWYINAWAQAPPTTTDRYSPKWPASTPAQTSPPSLETETSQSSAHTIYLGIDL